MITGNYEVSNKVPDFDGFIDEDIMERFDGNGLFYGDIINAQLIKTIRELIEEMKNEH